MRHVRTQSLPIQRAPRSGPGRQPLRDHGSVRDRLAALPQLQQAADDAIVVLSYAAVSARAAGATWQEIGDALGVSCKVAWKRYCEVERQAHAPA